MYGFLFFQIYAENTLHCTDFRGFFSSPVATFLDNAVIKMYFD